MTHAKNDEIRLFDSHCHLDMEVFRDNFDDVLTRAAEAGVRRALLAACDLRSSVKVINIAREVKRPDIAFFASAGVHPHEANSIRGGLPHEFEKLAADREVAAIGEIGLDYFYDNSPRDVQRAVFETQLEWAERAKKPILVHLRNDPVRDAGDAYGEAMAAIANHPKLSGGVIHCFSGNIDDARRALDLGFYISFAGPVTYPKSSELHEAAAYVPIDRILCETDSPYLPPQRMRGRRNEPAFVRDVYEKIAQLRGVSLNKFAASVWKNGEKLFGVSGFDL
ncbi:MAG: TatD family hydrolase [Synergistaceae bacterium]|jgi:TatD DNase family protein|nr:TatD family hydrolase [Synergistaceae bacterium]